MIGIGLTIPELAANRFVGGGATLLTDIGGMIVNYNAAATSTIAHVGGAVTQWNDRSGNGFTAVQSLGANNPTVSSIYGRPSLYFDQDSLNAPHDNGMNMGGNGATSLAVFSGVTGGTSNDKRAAILSKNSGTSFQSNYSISYIHSDASTIRVGPTLNASSHPIEKPVSTDYNFNDSATHIAIQELTGVASQLTFCDGDSAGFVSPNTVVNAVADNTDELTIGNRRGSNLDITLHIHEVVIFTPKLSEANRQLAEGILAWNWGLQDQLLDSHPYRWARP
jgi:hypothetical protein